MVATNAAAAFASDIENYIQEETMPLVRRQLVAYQFGTPLRLPAGRGTTYTAARYDRVNLPFAPLAEGIPPVGETMPLATVSVTAKQWGDTITITDVADLTIKHPLFQKAIELIAMQMAETLERNTFNVIMAGTQINYVNKRGARGSLVAGDVLNPSEISRAYAAMFTIGAPRFNADMEFDEKLDAGSQKNASAEPKGQPHYVAMVHPLVVQDLRNNNTIVTAWSYSDINRLYNAELGEWSGVRFTASNLIPFFVGNNGVAGTAGTSGALPSGTYAIQVTGMPTQTQVEQQIYAVTTGIVVTGPNGSISVTTPNLSGFVFNIYISVAGSTTPVNFGVSASGPTVGAFAGQAVQIPANTTVVVTAVGLAAVPPAAPANGVTVYPTFIIGKDAYAQVMLDDPKFSYLKEADKTDPLNQLRVVGWKCFYGTLIENQNFFMRIESTSAYSATFG